MIVCPTCKAELEVLSSVLINVEHLERGKWTLRCDCDHAFTMQEFIEAGATRKRGCEAIQAMRN